MTCGFGFCLVLYKVGFGSVRVLAHSSSGSASVLGQTWVPVLSYLYKKILLQQSQRFITGGLWRIRPLLELYLEKTGYLNENQQLLLYNSGTQLHPFSFLELLCLACISMRWLMTMLTVLWHKTMTTRRHTERPYISLHVIRWIFQCLACNYFWRHPTTQPTNSTIECSD